MWQWVPLMPTVGSCCCRQTGNLQFSLLCCSSSSFVRLFVMQRRRKAYHKEDNKRKNIYIYPLANMLTLGSWAVFFFFSFLSSVSTSSQSYIRKCMQHTYTHYTCANAAHTNSAYANGQLAMLSNVADWNYWKIIRKKKIYYRERKLVSGDTELTPISHFHPHDRRVYIQYIHAYTRLECLLHTDSGTTLYS